MITTPGNLMPPARCGCVTVRHADAGASNRVLTPRVASWWSRPGSDLDSALPPLRTNCPPPPQLSLGRPRPSEAAQPPLGPLLRSIARSACLTVLVTLPSPSRVWTPLPGENIIVVLEKPFAPLAGASNLWHHLPAPHASNTPLLKPPHGGRFQPRTTEGFMTRRRSTGKELLQLPVLGDLGFP